jgi:decaprenylphospho-beta-D-erythro-pentofuranosid-2-ulose 2-reductase
MSGKDPVLILGGGSDIGLAIAHAYAARGYPIQLALRSPAALKEVKADLEVRHNVSVSLHAWDALDIDGHGHFADNLPALPGIVVAAAGLLGDQEADRLDPEAASAVMRVNFEGPALALEAFSARMEARGAGTLIGISSVAGDRGRASNYVYGSAKAGFTAYLSGLRNRLYGTGVHVLTLKPGFVATKMVEGMDTPGPLTADPKKVARDVVSAVIKRRNVVYTKSIWWLVMSIICALPEAIFKKTSI